MWRYLPLERLAEGYDFIHHVWGNPRTERRVARIIFAVFLVFLFAIEMKREGVLTGTSFAWLPSSHFFAIDIVFTLILGIEMMSLIMSLSISLSRSLGIQFEILSLILLRNAFKELGHLPEPVTIAANYLPLVNIGITALGALIVFVCLGFYYRLHTFQNYIKSPEMRMRYVLSKKLLGLALFIVFTGLTIRDSYLFLTTGQDQNFFETIYTVLLFSDVALVLMAQQFMPSFHAVFRNSGFVIGTLLMRLSLSADAPWNTITSIFAAVFVLLLTWATSYFTPEAMKGHNIRIKPLPSDSVAAEKEKIKRGVK